MGQSYGDRTTSVTQKPVATQAALVSKAHSTEHVMQSSLGAFVWIVLCKGLGQLATRGTEQRQQLCTRSSGLLVEYCSSCRWLLTAALLVSGSSATQVAMPRTAVWILYINCLALLLLPLLFQVPQLLTSHAVTPSLPQCVVCSTSAGREQDRNTRSHHHPTHVY